MLVPYALRAPAPVNSGVRLSLNKHSLTCRRYSMSQPFRCYPSLPESQDLREYAGISEDIKQALKYIKVVEAQIAAQSRDIVVWEGLTSAAAIAYGRCFKRSGARRKLSNELFVVAPKGIQETHEYVIALRDKHIAHSENTFEQNCLVVDVKDYSEATVSAASISVHSRRLIGFSDTDIPALRSLFEWVLAEVVRLYEVEVTKVNSVVQSMPIAVLINSRNEPALSFLQPDAYLITRER
jgi:hypothetical protein